MPFLYSRVGTGHARAPTIFRKVYADLQGVEDVAPPYLQLPLRSRFASADKFGVNAELDDLAVAPYRMTMGASFSMARAIEIRCFSPPERLAPPSPMTVL